MTIEAALEAALTECKTVMLDRHAKYGAAGIGAAPGGALNGLRVRMHDKLARINNQIDSEGQADFADDAFRDAFIDLANYALIGLLVLDKSWPGPLKERREHATLRDNTDRVWRWGTTQGLTGYYWSRPDYAGRSVGFFSRRALEAYHQDRTFTEID